MTEKFRYLIIDEDYEVHGTDARDKAIECWDNGCSVIDTQSGMVLSGASGEGDWEEIPEIEEDLEDDADDDSVEEPST